VEQGSSAIVQAARATGNMAGYRPGRKPEPIKVRVLAERQGVPSVAAAQVNNADQ